MKISHKALLLGLASFLWVELPASAITSSRKSTRRKTTTTTVSSEYSQENCATKYILGLDRECYNTNNTSYGGVYSDCNDKSMAELYDIMDMQLSLIVGVDNFATYQKNCEQYKSYALNRWFASKGIVEDSALKGSHECVTSTKRLTAAKKCYTAAISHNGNFFEFSKLMNTTCGDYPDIASKFSKAGDVGLSNIPQLLENYSTFQFTNKSENWRSSVEAVLAEYIYEAKQACGEEDYELVEFNQFTEDKRENILSKARESFATEFSGNLGRRANNAITKGKATLDQPQPLIPNPSLSFTYYDGDSLRNISVGTPIIAPVAEVQNGLQNNKTTYKTKKHYDTTKVYDGLSSEDVENIYVIEDVSSLNKTRTRLLNILATHDVGSVQDQDDIDVAIISGLGGRAKTTDTGIYDIIGNLSAGDLFIIKQLDGVCQVLMLNENGGLDKVQVKGKNTSKTLKNYLLGCSRTTE